MFVLGLLLGVLLFFPTNQIKEKIFANISKSTGAVLQAESMSLGTGLGLGFSKGGIFALKFQKLHVQSESMSMDCDEATVSPHFVSLFVGKLALGLSCDSVKNGALAAKAVLKPFWSPNTLSVETNFKGLNLAALGDMLQSYPIKGIVYGDLTVDDMSLSGRSGMPALNWKISMQQAVLPPVKSDFISLPQILLGTLDTTGSLQNNKLVMKPLLMGNGTSPIKMNLDINLALSSQMMPMAGEIKGTLTANPEWEASIKNTLDLALLFGNPDAQGFRKFRKPVQGGPFSLLSPPQPY